MSLLFARVPSIGRVDNRRMRDERSVITSEIRNRLVIWHQPPEQLHATCLALQPAV